MYKRAIGFSLALALGLLVVEVLRQRLQPARHVPQFAPPYTPDPTPADLAPEIQSEIEAELETPPGVREVDMSELAFVAGAVGIDITPNASAKADETSLTNDEMTAYCMHCRTKRAMQDVRLEQASDGRRMARGLCPVCGGKMARFLKQAEG